ncbi:hypothetical protein HBI25_210910 [Parastagonospora nodorum]|nr:hypothetical protein HBI25_210910 [Parastagonospora nodorum]
MDNKIFANCRASHTMSVKTTAASYSTAPETLLSKAYSCQHIPPSTHSSPRQNAIRTNCDASRAYKLYKAAYIKSPRLLLACLRKQPHLEHAKHSIINITHNNTKTNNKLITNYPTHQCQQHGPAATADGSTRPCPTTPCACAAAPTTRGANWRWNSTRSSTTMMMMTKGPGGIGTRGRAARRGRDIGWR